MLLPFGNLRAGANERRRQEEEEDEDIIGAQQIVEFDLRQKPWEEVREIVETVHLLDSVFANEYVL